MKRRGFLQRVFGVAAAVPAAAMLPKAEAAERLARAEIPVSYPEGPIIEEAVSAVSEYSWDEVMGYGKKHIISR